jgi:hypothetical protein
MIVVVWVYFCVFYSVLFHQSLCLFLLIFVFTFDSTEVELRASFLLDKCSTTLMTLAFQHGAFNRKCTEICRLLSVYSQSMNMGSSFTFWHLLQFFPSWFKIFHCRGPLPP